MLLVSSLFLSLAAQTLAAGSINWHTNCKSISNVSSVPLNCANFSVPLDYTDAKSKKTLNLTLVRIDAVKKPVKGSILFNPGGPGDSAVRLVADGPQELLAFTGGHFNIIGFDSRGVNKTLPYACFKPGQADLFAPVLLNSSDTALGQNFANAEIQASLCQEATKDFGELVGTAFVARDMARIVDALGEDGLLRYWGFSYGTVLGATFSAMFPNKVGRVVLDGNVNVHDYYAGQTAGNVEKLDDVVAGFYSGCVSSSRCALARTTQDANNLANIVENTLESLKFTPIPLVVKGTPLVLDYTTVKNLMFTSMYKISEWSTLSQVLQGLVSGNITEVVGAVAALGGGGVPQIQSLFGIECGDGALRTDNVTDLEPLIARLSEQSQWGGLDSGVTNAIECAPWKQKAKEVYSGDWQVHTKNPLMLIGSELDPVTPLSNAVNNSASFSGSAVLNHNGYGHTSLSQLSLCTIKAVQAYLNDGVLPAAGTICQPTVTLFSNQSQAQILGLIANSTTAAKDKRDEDHDILAAVGRLRRRVI
ncbi:hypothetical protein H2200_008081 [Cladophialophora chaetospira]|uniref:Peptidase S33 tripeptidyl aminopeptidase-like C-terminal domain-containing protein n=1 Tax=Cladophialophora chaetospira TaxID=386627 RepID=A0AA38X6Z6_9EURO|nr:hypothetical protein H2200_008081 [Cladophialophora chaetospira]